MDPKVRNLLIGIVVAGVVCTVLIYRAARQLEDMDAAEAAGMLS